MLNVLPSIPLFEDLTEKQVRLIKPLFETVLAAPGKTLISQGEPAIYLYVILSGIAMIHYKPYDAPPLALTRLRAGDAFGWSAVTGSLYYSSSIISETDIEAIRIKRKALLQIVEQYPETGGIILERLALSVSPRWRHARQQVEKILRAGS
ncbi:MAG: hypothetical protein Fur002_04800 [Anaerolineales bacterium]